MCTSFKVKRSKVKVTRPTTAETESVSNLRNAKAYELQNCYVDHRCYQLPRPAIKAYKVGLLHAGGAYRVGRTRRPNNLFHAVLSKITRKIILVTDKDH